MDNLNNKGQHNMQGNNIQSYFVLSAILFAIIAIMDIAKLVNHASFAPGTHSIGWEWIGLIVTGLMCLWGFTSASMK